MLFRSHGAPEGVFTCVESPTLEDNAYLMRHKDVRLVDATGGRGAGPILRKDWPEARQKGRFEMCLCLKLQRSRFRLLFPLVLTRVLERTSSLERLGLQ